MHLLPLFCHMLALNLKIFSADMGVNFVLNGEWRAVYFSITYIMLPHLFMPSFFFLFFCSFSSYSFFFVSFLFHPSHLSSSPLAPYGATACVMTPLGPLCSAAYSCSITGLSSTKGITVSYCVLQATRSEDAKIQGARWKLLLLEYKARECAPG